MARKIILSTLLLILILGTTSFASISMNEETAQNILNYCSSKVQTTISINYITDTNIENSKQTFSLVSSSIFKEFFNLNFLNTLNTLNISGEISFNNISIIPLYGSSSRAYIDFIISNNTYSNTLPFTYLYRANPGLENEQTYNQFTITGTNSSLGTPNTTGSNIYVIRINISSTGGLTITNKTSERLTYYTTVNMEFDEDDTSINFSQLRGLSPSQVIYYSAYQSNVKKSYFLDNWYDADPSEPEIPDNPENPESGDTGGGTGGDTGGGTTTPDYSEDLDNIQTGITDINNNIGETNNKLDNISGELSNINNNLTTVPDISDTTITNDDITSNLDFEFEQDPYTNFWLELTTGLSNAFTNSKREISIQFRDKTHIISLDNFSVQIPSALKPFLTIISTVFITWKMLQYIKIIIDNISSGNIDEVLEMNEEEGITNLF